MTNDSIYLFINPMTNHSIGYGLSSQADVAIYVVLLVKNHEQAQRNWYIYCHKWLLPWNHAFIHTART